MASNVASNLLDYNPSEPNVDFRCGQSMFSDMEWDFNGYLNTEYLSKSRLKMKFHFVKHKPHIANVIKLFMVHELITGKFPTAKRSLDGTVRFVKFVDEYFPDVERISQMTPSLLKSYFEYLLVAMSETTGLPLSGTSIKKCALSIKDILLKGFMKGWDTPEDVRYVQKLYDEMIIFNKDIKRDTQKAEKEVIKRIHDEDLINKVVKIAMDDLKNDTNILIASSVVIGTQLGLRISEFMMITKASIEQIGGDSMLLYYIRKLTAEPIEVYKPANDLVIYAITKLQKYAKPLQEESGLPYLFLGRKRNVVGYPASLISHANWNKNFLRPWIKRHNICDKQGQLIDFTSHTFRHAFATYALKGGASIEVISEIMDHKSIRGTTHYAHLLQEDVKKRFAKVFHEGAVLSGKRALRSKKN